MVVVAGMKRVALKCQGMLEVGELLVVESRSRAQRSGRTLPTYGRVFVGKAALERHEDMSAVVDVICNFLQQCIIGDVERRNDEQLVL